MAERIKIDYEYNLPSDRLEVCVRVGRRYMTFYMPNNGEDESSIKAFMQSQYLYTFVISIVENINKGLRMNEAIKSGHL